MHSTGTRPVGMVPRKYAHASAQSLAPPRRARWWPDREVEASAFTTSNRLDRSPLAPAPPPGMPKLFTCQRPARFELARGLSRLAKDQAGAVARIESIVHYRWAFSRPLEKEFGKFFGAELAQEHCFLHGARQRIKLSLLSPLPIIPHEVHPAEPDDCGRSIRGASSRHSSLVSQ